MGLNESNKYKEKLANEEIRLIDNMTKVSWKRVRGLNKIVLGIEIL